MSGIPHRRGTALRSLLIVLTAAAAVPLIAVVLLAITYQSSRLEAQEQRPNLKKEEFKVFRDATIPGQAVDPRFVEDRTDAPAQYRPVTETEYREETVEMKVPVIDPATGQRVEKVERVTRLVPVVMTRYVEEYHSDHESRTAQLVKELKSMADDADEKRRDEKMEELRKQLEAEFSKMHERQAEEIERTQKRLESLKQLHQERGANRDKIVQRRIDELLGKPDSMRWNVAPRTPPVSLPFGDTLSPRQHSPEVPRSRHAGARVEMRFAEPVPAYAPGHGEQHKETRIRKIAQVKPTDPGIPGIASAGPGIAAAGPGVRPGTWQPNRTVIDELAVRIPSSRSLFDLVRRIAAAKTELRAKEGEMDRLEQLGTRDAVAASAIEKLASAVAQLKRQLQFDELELKSLAAEFERDLKLAEVSLQRLSEAREMLKSQFARGVIQRGELIEAELQLEKARKAREDAAAKLEQLSEAQGLVDGSASDPDETSSTPSPENVAPVPTDE